MKMPSISTLGAKITTITIKTNEETKSKDIALRLTQRGKNAFIDCDNAKHARHLISECKTAPATSYLLRILGSLGIERFKLRGIGEPINKINKRGLIA